MTVGELENFPTCRWSLRSKWNMCMCASLCVCIGHLVSEWHVSWVSFVRVRRECLYSRGGTGACWAERPYKRAGSSKAKDHSGINRAVKRRDHVSLTCHMGRIERGASHRTCSSRRDS